MPVINGKVVRARYTSLKLDEISSVDNPAQPGATASFIKRLAPPASAPSILALAVAKYVDEEDGAHTFAQVLQANEFDENIWPMTSALSQSIRSIMGDTTLQQADRETKVTQSVDEFLSAVRDISPAAEKKLAELISKRTDDMPKTIEQLEADLAKANGQITTLTAALDTEKVRAEKADGDLTAEKTAHAATQKALTEATDDVVKVGETEIRKSVVGEAQFSVAKALGEERDMARLEKRAGTEFAHVVGGDAVIAKVLKHIGSIPDEETRKAAEAIITSAESMAVNAFKSFGGRMPEAVRKTAADFESKITEIMKRDSCSRLVALEKVTVEAPEAFEAYQESGQELAH